MQNLPCPCIIWDSLHVIDLWALFTLIFLSIVSVVEIMLLAVVLVSMLDSVLA